MKEWRLILPGMIIILSACNGPAPQPITRATPLKIATTPPGPSADITTTNTPTIIGTWETSIRGVISDQSSAPEKPIFGATITYDVVHTYYPGLQEGRANQVLSDENGEFSLRVLVHDTDHVRILVEAPGYATYEIHFTGIDLVVGKRLEIGLNPE